MSALPKNVEQALSPLLGSVGALGYIPAGVQLSSSFGDFLVTFRNGKKSFAIARDRLQFIVQGEKAELEPVGLWRGFGSAEHLEGFLLKWLQQRDASP